MRHWRKNRVCTILVRSKFMLDLGNLIPAEISGTHIAKEISERQIRISGSYRNHRKFNLVLKRFVDEFLFYFGLGLFAGEGTKDGKGTPFEFANSNPKIIGTVMKLLNQLGIQKSTISPRVQVRIPRSELVDEPVQNLARFWSEYLGIPTGKFRKPSIRVKEGRGRSDYGTVSIRINSGIIGTLFNFWTNQVLRDNASSFPDRRMGTGFLAMRRQPGVSRS